MGFITLKNNWKNPCVKTEGKCNESVNNEFKEEKQFITSSNESEQIMKLTHRIQVCLIIFEFIILIEWIHWSH